MYNVQMSTYLCYYCIHHYQIRGEKHGEYFISLYIFPLPVFLPQKYNIINYSSISNYRALNLN